MTCGEAMQKDEIQKDNRVSYHQRQRRKEKRRGENENLSCQTSINS
jgi:hypothetical protein